MVFYISIFLSNLIFNNVLINALFNRNEEALKQTLLYLKEDLDRISFPGTVNINLFFIAFLLSVLITPLLKIFIFNNFSIDDPLLILKDTLKIFFIYCGSIFSFLYLFRFYNFSRGILLLGLAFFPIIFYLLILFLNLKFFKNFLENRFINASFVILLFITVGIFSIQSLRSENNENVEYTNAADTVETNIITTTTIEIETGKSSDVQCLEWAGTDNFVECVSGTTIINAEQWSNSLNNIVFFKEDMYVIDVSGKVFKNNTDSLYLDLSEQIFDRVEWGKGELGLFSMAFHPTDNYFLISYVNTDNNLEVARYTLDENENPIIQSKDIIYQLASSGHMHYGGNIIWSEFFEDFILSIGDNFVETFDTTTTRGKLLFVNKKISEPDLISEDKLGVARNDILAFGLRNPWKTYEYKNFLFVPDIQQYTQEELNVVDLNEFNKSKKPYLFGWPYFEATLVHEPFKNICDGTKNKVPDTCDKDKSIFFGTLLHKDGKSENIEKYIIDNSIPPKVAYDHNSPDIYRAAIIGGGVIKDRNSRFFEHYIYADYISNELFAYDFINDELRIITLEPIGGEITSLIIHELKENTILLTTRNGFIIEVLLP